MITTSAIILAGGFGTRLKSVVSDVPKPMAPILEKPFLTYLLGYLNAFQIKQVVLSTGYLSSIIENYLGNNFNGIKLRYSIEEEPLGTGGAIKKALQEVSDENTLVLNGDSFLDLDIFAFSSFYTENNFEGLLACRSVDNAGRYGTLKVNNNQIVEFKEKTGTNELGLINGGVYLLNKEHYLKNTPTSLAFSIEKDYFEKQCQHSRFGAYKCDGYFIDIGIPEDYLKAQHEFKKFKY
jgi:D-glycero-alpha-D-manno-heptose 1-phosphate guanylyltransferase